MQINQIIQQVKGTRYSPTVISFDPVKHKYVDQNNREYKSVTTFIGEFYKKFPTQAMAEKKAKDYNWTKEEVLNYWNDITEKSLEKGNFNHNLLEESIDDSLEYDYKKEIKRILDVKSISTIFKPSFISVDDPRLKVCEDVLNFLVANGYSLFSEVRTFLDHPVTPLAGTIDVLAIKGDRFCIVDWKTNKRPIHFEAGYYKKEFDAITQEAIETDQFVSTNDYMFPPISHLPDCNGIKYMLQLSHYANMLETQWGLTCDDIQLVHIRHEEDVELRGGEPVPVYTMGYMKEEARYMLDFYPELQKRKQSLFNTL